MDYRIERAQVLVAQTMERLRRVDGNVREIHGALLDLKSAQVFLADIGEKPEPHVGPDRPSYCEACLFDFTETDGRPESVRVNGRWRLMHGSCYWRLEHGGPS